MPLFDNFPYSNLHELNLDWVIAKLKDVDKAQMTAEEATTLLNQVSGKADEAAASALAAASDASDAHTDALHAKSYADSADAANVSALQAKSDANDSVLLAKGYRDSALTASGNADNQALAAYNYKVEAGQSASDAYAAKVDAEAAASAANADANRAQAYGASTGVASLAGTITAQSGDDVSLNDGTYVIIYFGTDAQSSRGMNMFTLHSSTLVSRNLIQSGANVIMSTNGANVLHIVNFMGDGDMKYLILGYMEP